MGYFCMVACFVIAWRVWASICPYIYALDHATTTCYDLCSTIKCISALTRTSISTTTTREGCLDWKHPGTESSENHLRAASPTPCGVSMEARPAPVIAPTSGPGLAVSPGRDGWPGRNLGGTTKHSLRPGTGGGFFVCYMKGITRLRIKPHV